MKRGCAWRVKPQNPCFPFWRVCEMKRDSHCRPNYNADETHAVSKMFQSLLGQQPGCLQKQGPGHAFLIAHVQALCWHRKHFCKSHQITLFKVLHEVSNACLFFFLCIRLLTSLKLARQLWIILTAERSGCHINLQLFFTVCTETDRIFYFILFFKKNMHAV